MWNNTDFKGWMQWPPKSPWTLSMKISENTNSHIKYLNFKIGRMYKEICFPKRKVPSIYFLRLSLEIALTCKKNPPSAKSPWIFWYTPKWFTSHILSTAAVLESASCHEYNKEIQQVLNMCHLVDTLILHHLPLLFLPQITYLPYTAFWLENTARKPCAPCLNVALDSPMSHLGNTSNEETLYCDILKLSAYSILNTIYCVQKHYSYSKTPDWRWLWRHITVFWYNDHGYITHYWKQEHKNMGPTQTITVLNLRSDATEWLKWEDSGCFDIYKLSLDVQYVPI